MEICRPGTAALGYKELAWDAWKDDVVAIEGRRRKQTNGNTRVGALFRYGFLGDMGSWREKDAFAHVIYPR